MTDANVILEMQNVSKVFKTPTDTLTVLQDVDIRVEQGEFIIVTGPSGSGKSTFLHLGALLDSPSSGEIFFARQETSTLHETRLAELRKEQVGVVFQKYHLLLHRTVLENIRFRFRYVDYDREYVARRVEHALTLLNLDDLSHRPVRLLSGGEMQRVAIARAIVLEPKLLIADEPTGNLDAQSTAMVMDCFQKLNGDGITILMVTHDLSLLKFCSRYLTCQGGTIGMTPR